MLQMYSLFFVLFLAIMRKKMRFLSKIIFLLKYFRKNNKKQETK